MEKELEKMGLTNNEIKVYNSLLEVGENTVGPIIRKLGMHRQVGYDALEGLIKKRMVIRTTKNNRHYFRIADPKNILENVKQKEEVAKNLIEEINNKIAGQKKGQEIRVYEGEKAYRDFVKRKDDMQPPNSEYLVVTGASNRFKEIMNKSGVFERSNKIRKKKNIKTKLIFCNIDRAEGKKVGRVNSEIRFLPKGYDSPTSFEVWHDSIALSSYGNEVFSIEIKNKDFHKAYKNYFNFLWGVAEK